MANGLLDLIARPEIADIPGQVFQGQQRQQQNLLNEQANLQFQQRQEQQARQQQAQGLAGAALQQRIGGDIGEIAALDPELGIKLLNATGVIGEKRQAQFTEDVRIAASLAQSDPLKARAFVEQSIKRNESQGIPSPNMREFLTELDSDPAAAVQTLQQFNQALSKSGPKEREIRVKERGVELREQEIEQRALDRQASNESRAEAVKIRREESELKKEQLKLTRETNQLKRDELQKEIQSKQRNLQFEASNAVDGVQASIDLIDRLSTGEGLESAAGISSAFPTLPGTAAANFEAELETFKSQAFLTQVEKMKGLGALSENEGKKLGAAIGALDLSQSDKALRASLKRIKDTLSSAKTKLQKKFNVQPQVQQADAQQTTAQESPPPGTAAPSVQIGRFTVEVE